MDKTEIVKQTAANVFSYIVDHGEMIPEEECQRMLHDFLKSKRYNNIASQPDNAADFVKRCDSCGCWNKAEATVCQWCNSGIA